MVLPTPPRDNAVFALDKRQTILKKFDLMPSLRIFIFGFVTTVALLCLAVTPFAFHSIYWVD
jgi:hypothetical protein